MGGTTETVTVSADAALVDTRSSERAGLISADQVSRLLVRGRNFTDLLQTMPGIVQTTKSQDLSSATNFYVMGNRQTSNNVTIDGVPATDMGNGSQLKLTVSQDAVAEVKVETSNYQAEYGRMAGSNVIVVTKSGTKEFHGLLSYFKRHEQFNANDFFNNLTGISRPRYRYNTWTYNISGPVMIPKLFNRDRNKLFFYWGQEFWPTVTNQTGNVTVPTALERAGDFSQTLDQNNRLITMRDPYNGNTPFPDNKIPANRQNASGLALLKMFPQPNFLNRAISGGNYNYVFAATVDAPKQTNTGKVDFLLNSKNTITGTFNTFSDDREGSVGLPSTGSLNWPLMVKRYYTHPVSVAARWTSVLSATVVNEATFGFLDQPARDTFSDSELAKIQRDKVGFTVPQFAPSANPLNIIPNATFGGVPGAANLAAEGRFPLYNDYYIYTWSDNLTATRGSHTIKAGIYLERFMRNQKKAVAFNGTVDFAQNVNNPLTTGYAYANAALGTFNQYTEATGLGWMNVNAWDTEAFIQDNWKVSRKLTLDFGLRMYWIKPMTESDNLISAFVPGNYDARVVTNLVRPALVNGARVGQDPVSGTTYAAAQIGALAPSNRNSFNGMVQAGTNGLPDSILQNRGVQWGPRVGFAYDLRGNGKTAIRGGFGTFYNRFFTETFFGNMIAQPPLVQTPIITYGSLSTLNNSGGLVYPSNVYGPDLQGKLPMVMNYSLSVQHEIAPKTVLDVAYAASLGRHLVWFRDLNQIPLGTNFLASSRDQTTASSPLPAPFLRPTKGYNAIYSMEGASSSNYNSLQVTLHRRFANRLQFGVAYTWSKAMSYNDNDTDVVTSLINQRSYNYATAGFDRTQVANINYIYELPSTPWKNPVTNLFLNGWQVSGITSYSSGAPLAIGLTTTNGADITGTASLTPRVNVAGDPNLPGDQRTFGRNFDTSVFKLPAVGTYGNAGRFSIRGPGIANFDASVAKNFTLYERLRFTFRAEAYNVFNHTQFAGLDTTARFDPAGQQVNARFGAFTSSRDPRQMQFALRLSF